MPISQITGASIQDGSIVVADLGITTFNTGTGNTLTLQANSATGLVIDVTGNTAIANTLSFTGTSARIRGDFSSAGASIANRVYFQTNTANSTTAVAALPSGTGINGGFLGFNNSDPTNAAFIGLQTSNGTEARITSGITGTGTYLPLTMFTGGSERLRIDTSGNVGIGTSTPDSFSRGYTRILGLSSTGSTALEINSATGSNAVIDMGVNGTRSFSITTDGTTPYISSIGVLPIGFAINGVERMRISSTGRLGIGTDTPSQLLHVAAGTILASNTSTNSATVAIAGNGSAVGTSAFELIQGGSSEAYVYNRANSYLVLGTNNAERMRIDSSGNLLVGTTTVYQAAKLSILLDPAAQNGLATRPSSNASYYGAAFQNSSGTRVGDITVTSSATAYNTSSDYRLKENIAPMTGALAKVAQLKPCTYSWKVDGSQGEGFIAHELAEVVPQAVTGEKDGINKDGNPEYQGIDVSFLVATLTAAIQEQQAIIESLTARIETLEQK